MTDEGSDVTRGDCISNLSVDKVGEPGDSLLEEAVGNVHDTGSILENSSARADLHFRGSIKETVAGNFGVGVNDENVVTHADVTISPGAALVFLNNIQKSLSICRGLVLRRPGGVAFEGDELFLDTDRDPHT